MEKYKIDSLMGIIDLIIKKRLEKTGTNVLRFGERQSRKT